MMINNVPAPGTVTWYEGDALNGKVSAYLNQRLLEMLQANKWLAGRLATVDGEVAIVYSKNAPSQRDVDQICT